MVSGGLGSREAAMDALLGSQPLYWQHREEVLARHPIRFCYLQLLTPGLPEVLHTLHSAGLVLAVVSNSSVEVVDGALQQCGIRPYFQQIFSGWQIPQCKPDPYLYRQAMQGLRPVAGNLTCGGGFSRWHLCRTGRRPASGGPAGP